MILESQCLDKQLRFFNKLNVAEKISQKDIYDAITDLRREILVEIKDVKRRVDVLEEFKGYVTGIGAVITIFIGGFATWVWSKVTGR